MAARQLEESTETYCAKFRIVGADVDRTVIAEPSVTSWHVNKIGLHAHFWTTEKWNALPPMARPASAQKQGDDGYLVLLPA